MSATNLLTLGMIDEQEFVYKMPLTGVINSTEYITLGELSVKVGNAVDFIFQVLDANGDLVTNLTAATAVKFMAKTNKTDLDASALISKDLTNGITVDDPSLGYIKVSLTSANTTIAAGRYFYALQIEWLTQKVELDIFENITDSAHSDILVMIQDVVR
jgi:hypothetical protein